jgi:hypothetical protein
MSQARTCASCGAPPTEESQRFCGFCGAELPALPAPQTVVVQGGRWGDLEQRFRNLAEHPSMEELLQHTPSSAGRAMGLAGRAALGVAFMVIAGFTTTFFMAFAGPLAILPMFFLGVGAVVTISSVFRSAKVTQAPLRRVNALVVDERIRVSGGGEHSSATTTYHATIQDPEGHRAEYLVDERIASAITEGDMGVAYLKADHMIDFVRVDV